MNFRSGKRVSGVRNSRYDFVIATLKHSVLMRMRVLQDEVVLHKTAFWVGVRGRRFGPFDYEWSPDLRGIELTYQGQKFGEICSTEELFADLAEFKLPISVCRVATIAAGTLALGIANGVRLDGRIDLLMNRLQEFGFGRFRVRSCDDN